MIYKNNIDKLAWEKHNHIHRLSGFLINWQHYNIDIEIIKGVGNGDIEILIENSGFDLTGIRNLIYIDLKQHGEYNESDNYIVHFNLEEEFESNIEPIQYGGGEFEFPVPIMPYLCRDYKIYLNFITGVGIYNEPGITFINRELLPEVRNQFREVNLDNVLSVYYQMCQNVLSASKFRRDVDKLTSENLADGSYRNILIYDHLIANKYAHNGFSDSESLDRLIERFNFVGGERFTISLNNRNYYILTIIHTITHILDSLYMHKPDSGRFLSDMSRANEINKIFKNLESEHCLYRTLNEYSSDFLQKNESGTFFLYPYQVKDEALAHKIRQYSNTVGLIDSFELQIQRNITLEPESVTDKPPNTI